MATIVAGSPANTTITSGLVDAQRGVETESIRFNGELQRFSGVGSLTFEPTIRLDGEDVDPAELVETHTIVLQSALYRDRGEDDLQPVDIFGATFNSGDTTDGNTASGSVSTGLDAYTYTGSLVQFNGRDTACTSTGNCGTPQISWTATR